MTFMISMVFAGLAAACVTIGSGSIAFGLAVGASLLALIIMIEYSTDRIIAAIKRNDTDG